MLLYKMPTRLAYIAVFTAPIICNAAAQNCDYPGEARRDCYPWPDLDHDACVNRGCSFCPGEDRVTWCFIDDEVCPSELDQNDRVDCHPDPNSSRETCNARGCIWCPHGEPGIPWCFHDHSLSQGGPRCPGDITDNERIDCAPEENSDEATCLARGCFWCSSATPGVPWCFMPKQHGYRLIGGVGTTPKGYRVQVRRVNTPSWFGADVDELTVDVEFQENYRVRVKIYDPSTQRYEVPLNITSPEFAAPNPLVDVQFFTQPAFGFRLIRRATQEILIEVTGLQFADQYLQFSAKLPTQYIYGFGETEHHQFVHDLNWRTWAMWARDQPVTQGNLYSVHPFFTAFNSNSNMFGGLILNSNAMEVTMTPLPGFQYRTIGGILDLYFFLGPEPESVIAQYTEAIGKPVMPPYWALGFQPSRYGYNTIDNMKEAVERMCQHDIPHDVQHGDLDYFERQLDFRYDAERFPGFPEYIRELKQEGTRFITLLNPFISTAEAPGTYPAYDRGQAADVWLKEADGTSDAISDCWPDDPVVYPDYTKQSAVDWWIQECVDFHGVLEFDALWIDMNEPASFVTGSIESCQLNALNEPLYKPKSMLKEKCAWEEEGGRFCLADKTLCLDYLSELGDRYNVHSLYGWSSSEPSLLATRAATGNKRSYVVTRSTYPGSGKWAGRWMGDNNSDWPNMAHSIIGILEFNLFGIPYVGADICGFFSASNPALCQRWMQIGAFYTFSRNHNGNPAPQDPGLWPEVATSSRAVLHIRYRHLPYLYTLFHEVHTWAGTVIRPLMHEFPQDVTTYTLDTEFMWGPGFLIIPVLEEGATAVNAYFPDARWYSISDGAEVPVRGDWAIIEAPLDEIPLFVRGGYILPTQESANSTMWSRHSPLGLTVALDDDDLAAGSLFWDEGDTINTYEDGVYFLGGYSASGTRLTGVSEVDSYDGARSLYFKDILVYGVAVPPTGVLVNDQPWLNYDYNASSRVLHVYDLQIQLTSEFIVSW